MKVLMLMLIVVDYIALQGSHENQERDDEWWGGLLLFRAVLMQSDFSITSDLAV